MVFANGIPLARAMLGTRNGKVALRILKFLERKQFNFDFGDLL